MDTKLWDSLGGSALLEITARLEVGSREVHQQKISGMEQVPLFPSRTSPS